MSIPNINTDSRSGPTLRAISQYYCPFCDKQVYTSITRIPDSRGNKCPVRVCLNCSEIIAAVPAPRLVGIEPNPGPSKNKKSNNSRRRRKPNQSSSMRRIHPSQVQTAIHTKHKFRFATTTSLGGSAEAITVTNILGALGMVATTATNLQNLYESFKIHEIEIWACPPVSGTNTSTAISIEWEAASSQQFSSNMEINDASVSTAAPAYIRARPPKGSAAGFWNIATSGSSTATLFAVNSNVNLLLDLTIEAIVRVDNSVVINQTVASATLGGIYYLALDGPTTNLILPLSLPTTH